MSRPDPPLTLAVETSADGLSRLVLRGELDMSVVPAVEERLDGAIDGGLVLDLSGLKFIDSSGLRLILQLREAAERDGWTLQLVPGPPEVQRVFQLVDLEDRLPFLESSRPL